MMMKLLTLLRWDRRRKFSNFLIYPRFQLALIAVQVLVTLGIFVAVLWRASASFAYVRAMVSPTELPATHAYYQVIEFQKQALYGDLAIAFAIGIAFSVLVTLIISFRISGPIYRLRKYFREIVKSGSVPSEPLTFRKGDFYSDLPPVVNEAVGKLVKGNSQP